MVGFYDHEASWCDQLVDGPTSMHPCATLDLLMTDIPDLVPVAITARTFDSDHLSLSEVISMAQAVPNLCVNRKVFLKHQVNWNTVGVALQDLPWHNIWSADNPVDVLNEHLSLLVGRYIPTRVIRVCYKDKPWFDDQCMGAFDLKQDAHLRWTRDRSRVNWEQFIQSSYSNETYLETKRLFNARAGICY